LSSSGLSGLGTYVGHTPISKARPGVFQHEGKQFVLIRDSLGLVPEGKAVGLPLYQIMTLLDGNTTIRDVQMELMRQRGGVLVGTDEIMNSELSIPEPEGKI